MKKITKRLLLLFLGSIVLGVSASAGVYSEDFFAIKIKTDNDGSSSDTEFTLPINPAYTYDYNIVCDDNNHTNKYLNQSGSTTCTYDTAGTYTVLVAGAGEDLSGFPAIYFSSTGDKAKILEVVQWGTGKWQTMSEAFQGAYNLTVTALDNPDLSQTESLAFMFTGASSLTFTNPINDWNVSSVTSMYNMFLFATIFNKDIGDWDVSNVENMNGMFNNADTFNQDIGDWNVSSVTDMTNMFKNAYAFNQDIGDWNVSSVLFMDGMFFYATIFNQDIGDWNVLNVKSMNNMFSKATAFNLDIGDWDVSNVENMNNMFNDADAFNQDIGDWDVSNVENMSQMFNDAVAFNQDIGDWDVSSVLSIDGMFIHAYAFNQDIGDWNLQAIADPANFEYMFYPNSLSVSNYDNLLNSWSKLDLVDSVAFNAGHSDYCQGKSAKTLMESENDDSWSFEDGNENCDFYIITPNKVSIKSGETMVINVNANIDEGVDTYHYITGGADQNKFTMNTHGELEFIVAPDANNPTDRNSDNTYRVQVSAENQGYATDYQTIKVTVAPDSNAALVPIISYLLF